VAAQGGQVWVTDSTSGDVIDFSVSSGKVVQTVHVGNDPRGLALVGDSVWVANNLDGTVSRIDARSASITATLPVGAGPASVVADGKRVWVAAQDAGWLTEVDPSRARVLRHVRTGSRPVGLALQGSRLWVTAGANPALHRGGTEHVVLDDSFDVDPALGYYDISESVDAILYDGLLGFRRTAGAAGSTVVPDLAVALPTVTDGGRTFDFRLRKGVTWSNGKPVTGADIKRGLERTVAARQWPLYNGIVGATACTKSACDLSRGVVADDAAGLLTIHITAPDPDFVYKLALLGAVAVPATTPLAALHGNAVLPSTGPYVVKTRTADQTVLVRNNRFHEWSAAAQPLGYPDTLEFTRHSIDGGQVAVPNQVIAATDWALLHGTPDLAALRARFGARVRTSAAVGTQFLALNTSGRPFNDVRVRRAVAYAIDRAAVLAEWAFPGTVACQLLPPTIPSYQPYCPYTLHPREGTWDGPDIATAQDLVRAAGARGVSVSVWAPPGMKTAFASIVRSMRTIKLDAHLHVVTGTDYFPAMVKAANVGRAQAMFDGWIADYPAASNFFDTELTCDSFVVRGGSNVGRFCDPAYDRVVTTAERLQSKDPAAAAAEWVRLDRMTSDLSPIVPLVTPVRIDVVSTRLRNVQSNAGVGALFDQAWVR
jgi:peptide/nickel transport system substrate-binding protein